MTGCENIREELSAYLDGELPAASQAEVREHLAGCEGCRAEHEALVRLGRQVEALPRISAPGHFTAQVMARVIQEPAPRLASSGRTGRRGASERMRALALEPGPALAIPLGGGAAPEAGCASEEELSTLQDDALPPEQAARLRAHLPGCERCRGVNDELVRLRARLQALRLPGWRQARINAPPGFVARVLEAIAAWEQGEERRREAERALRARWWSSARWVAQAAAVLLLVGVGTALSTPAPRQVASGRAWHGDRAPGGAPFAPPAPRAAEKVAGAEEPPPLPDDHEARIELSATVEIAAAAEVARAVIQAHAREWQDQGNEKAWSGYVRVPANRVDDLLHQLVATPELEGVGRDVEAVLARVNTELDRVELKSGHVLVGQVQPRRGGGVSLRVGGLTYDLPERDVLRVERAGDLRRIRFELRGRD